MLGKTVSANVIFLMYYRLLVKVVCYFGMMCSLGDLVSRCRPALKRKEFCNLF